MNHAHTAMAKRSPRRARLASLAARVVATSAAVVILTACAPLVPGDASRASSAPADAAGTASAEPAAPELNPGAVAVIGDSISRGFAACGQGTDCPELSWALGTDPSVDSVLQRLARVEGAARPAVWAARSGARLGDVLTGLAAARETGGMGDEPVALVLIQIGANDVCRGSEAEITPPASFAADYRALLGAVHAASPDARIVALSVPDIARLQTLGAKDAAVAGAWQAHGTCASMFANPTSIASADVERRARVASVVHAYDAAIAELCASTPNCVSDDGAVAGLSFERGDLSPLDYFHPSAQGQSRLADVAWQVLLHAQT